MVFFQNSVENKGIQICGQPRSNEKKRPEKKEACGENADRQDQGGQYGQKITKADGDAHTH